VSHRLAVVLVLFVLAAGCSRRPDSITGSPASAGPVATVDLTPVRTGTAAEPITVTVPAGSVQVQYRLAGLDAKGEELTAELEAVGGDQIKRWRVDDVPPDPLRGAHAVVVPVYEARPGEYVLTVWLGDAGVAQRYRFRVQTP
jgi:hypothetical protein